MKCSACCTRAGDNSVVGGGDGYNGKRTHGVGSDKQSVRRSCSPEFSGPSVYYDANQSLPSLDDKVSMIGSVEESGVVVSRPLKPSLQQRNRRTSSFFRQNLESPVKVVDSAWGYPGHLTEKEFDACVKFRKQLRERESVYRDMVDAFSPVEDEAFAVCRFMRSRNFNLEEVFRMMDGYLDLWKEGKENNFFPDAEEAVGAPESVLLTQFPLLISGRAKNACPIAYFDASNIHLEGIECVTALERIPNYVWHVVMHKLKDCLEAEQKLNAPIARFQLVLLFDLKGLALTTLKQVMQVLEKALRILSVFPEILFCCVLLNSPRYFPMMWKIIKTFIDPNTASKIEVYSNELKGRKRVLELIDANELASNFGGSAASTAKQISAMGTGEEVNRRFIRIISPHKQNEAVYEFDLTDGENAKITVYTNSPSGADLTLFKSNEQLKHIDVINTERVKGGNFSVGVMSALNGKGRYRISIKPKAPQPGAQYQGHNHFLIIGDVTKT